VVGKKGEGKCEGDEFDGFQACIAYGFEKGAGVRATLDTMSTIHAESTLEGVAVNDTETLNLH
jgi:hypothetical protein